MNFSNNAKKIADSCRFCWMCRHVCPIGNADGQERNTARARALMVSLVVRGTEKPEDIADNMYECTLCGACTNNCKTGWDPKVFIQEAKTQLLLEGKAPKYINEIINKYMTTGTVFDGKIVSLETRPSNSLVMFSHQAMYLDKDAVKKAYSLLKNSTVDKDTFDSGYLLYFLTGKTNETVNQAKKCAEAMNKYDEVIVYNPVELSFIAHQYKEWGINVKTKFVSFETKLLELIAKKEIKVNKGNNVYTLQDNYAQARELDDVETGRKLINLVGENKEMLLHGKEANMAGNLIMDLYMHEKMLSVAKVRWGNAVNMGCHTLVTVNPDEHVLLGLTAPKGYKVITIEEMILENM